MLVQILVISRAGEKTPIYIAYFQHRGKEKSIQTYLEFLRLSSFYVEKQVPFSHGRKFFNRVMHVGTAPIFKINLLLADISFLDSCRIFSYFKVWARESEL